MAKFLSIPVTNEGNQLVSAEGIKKQASTTTVTITYGGAAAQDVITITHAAVAAGSEEMRDVIQDAVVDAHQSVWHNVVTTVAPSKAVSAIAIA